MKYGISFAILLLCSALAQAAPPSEQSVDEMMGIMQLDDVLNQSLKQMNDGMMKQMEQSLQKSLQGKELSAPQKTAMEKYRATFTATMKDELSPAKVKEIYTQAYRETFTQEEVDGILAFYKSSAGKAILEKSPTAMQKANSLTQARIAPMTRKLETMQEEFLKDLGKTK